MKRIVTPGELVTKEDKKMLSGVYKDAEGIRSEYVGVVYDNDIGIKVVPLKGKYSPKVGDVIIGKVITDDPFIHLIEVNSHKMGVIPKRTLEGYLNVNDIALMRVTVVNEVRDFDLEFMKKLYGGTLLEISPKKVARVIGKSRSMLEMIQKYTDTRLSVGGNGLIYVVGGNIALVKEVLEKIEEYSHVDNLTDKIEEFLKSKTEKKM